MGKRDIHVNVRLKEASNETSEYIPYVGMSERTIGYTILGKTNAEHYSVSLVKKTIMLGKKIRGK